MKTIFLSLFSLFFFASCSPTKGNKTEIFKTYNHPDYTFNYPKNWSIIDNLNQAFDDCNFVHPDMITIAPKRGIINPKNTKHKTENIS